MLRFHVLWLLLFLPSLAPAQIIARHGDSYLERIQDQRILHLKGSYREMGLAHGKLLAQEVAEDAEFFLDHWLLGGNKEKLETIQRIWNTFEPFLPRRYQEELAGLAEGSGVPLARLQLLHAIPERFHCTGVAAMNAATRDGKLYHTRSLDYALDIGSKTKRAQDNALLIIYHPPDGQPYCVVGWSGFIGCVSGMNARGISIGEMGSACKDEAYDGIPMIFLMREALRQSEHLQQALDVFRRGPRTCGYNFLIGDGKIPDARAIEVTRTKFAEFKPGDQAENVGPHFALPCCIRRVNHFVSPELSISQRGDKDVRDANPASWVGYSLISQWLKENHGSIDDRKMIQLLRMYPPMLPCLHQVVFCPGNLDLWISHAAGIRGGKNAGAQNQPFYRYNLRSLLNREPASNHLAIEVKETPVAEPVTSSGTVRFKSNGDEDKLPVPYRLDSHQFPWDMSLKHNYEQEGFQIHAVTFPSAVTTRYPENNTVHCEWYRPTGPGPFPAAVVLDILGGDQTLARVQSTYLAKKGIACLFVQMAYYGPRRPAGGKVRLIMPDIDHSLAAVRQTVLDVRRAAAWLETRPEVDRQRLGIIGTSLGSFMGTLAAEMEPRFRKVAIVLGGGGVVDAFYDHPYGAPFRTVWVALGGSKAKLQQRIACADPITCAANLKDRQVIMIGASRDDVIPPAATRRMWDALGRPKIIWYDATHTGAIVYILPAINEVIEHFKK
jgi:dienelactone hydrolase/predicted choloylglycine hydrolase